MQAAFAAEGRTNWTNNDGDNLMSSILNRRHVLLAGTAAAAISSLPRLALSQTSGAVPFTQARLIVPNNPGGLGDVSARMLSAEVAKELGISIIVENRPGGNMVTGVSTVASAKPDGSTLGFVSGSTLVIQPHLMKERYPDAMRQLKPVSILYGGPVVVVVNEAHPAKSLSDLIQRVKQDKKPLIFGCTGVGGLNHLAGELLGQAAGIQVEPVPYPSEVNAVNDMLGNNLSVMIGIIESVRQHLPSGKLRVLAVASEKRVPTLPDVPTIRELGYPDVVAHWWQGVVAPAGTPDAVVETLHRAYVRAIQLPASKEKFAADIQIFAATPQQSQEIVQRESKLWSQIITQRGITAKI